MSTQNVAATLCPWSLKDGKRFCRPLVAVRTHLNFNPFVMYALGARRLATISNWKA